MSDEWPKAIQKYAYSKDDSQPMFKLVDEEAETRDQREAFRWCGHEIEMVYLIHEDGTEELAYLNDHSTDMEWGEEPDVPILNENDYDG